MGATISAVLLVGLFAAGLGLLGGRPESVPTSSVVTASGAAPTPAASATRAAAAPRVTPASRCGQPRADVPDVFLESESTRVAGATEFLGAWGGGVGLPTGQPGATGVDAPRVEVRPGAVSELWIDNGACAVAWTIELFDPVADRVAVIEALDNDALDPAYATQNRFALPTLAAHRGLDRDLELRATLTFTRIRMQARWAIRILPLPWPAARLEGLRASVPVVPGCDLVMRLGNGWEEEAPGSGCEDDVSADLPAATRVRPGESLELGFDGWTATNAMVVCGHLSGRSFVSQPVPGCWLEIPAGAAFSAPAEGGWTLQIGACAAQVGSNGANSICGTWYANIEVR